MLARNMSAWSSKHQDSSSCWDLIPSSRMIYLFLHQPDEFPHTSFTWLTSPHMHRVHSDYLLIKRPRRRKRYGLKIVTAQALAGIGELISNCAWNPLRRMVGKTRAMYSRRRGLLKTHFSSLLIPLTCSNLFTLTPVCHKVHALPRHICLRCTQPGSQKSTSSHRWISRILQLGKERHQFDILWGWWNMIRDATRWSNISSL